MVEVCDFDPIVYEFKIHHHRSSTNANFIASQFQTAKIGDSETMIKIKKFMVSYGIIDIKMGMLNISELKQIQGFPKDYKLIGTQTEQKKIHRQRRRSQPSQSHYI